MSQEHVEIVRRGAARWRAGDHAPLARLSHQQLRSGHRAVFAVRRFQGEPDRGHNGLRAWLADIQENFEPTTDWCAA